MISSKPSSVILMEFTLIYSQDIERNKTFSDDNKFSFNMVADGILSLPKPIP